MSNDVQHPLVCCDSKPSQVERGQEAPDIAFKPAASVVVQGE